MTGLVFLRPAGRPRPKGYADGVLGAGRLVLLSGQIGWDAQGRFRDGLVGQTEQALANILAVLAEAGAGPERIARLVWYLVDIEDYRARQGEIGAAYRRLMGLHFPAMSAVQVARLVEPAALVEIEATALL